MAGEAPDDKAELSHLEERLTLLLSVIAGMVDITGFLTLGNIFTAHITGNLVLVAAAAVRGGPLNPAQAIAIPMFMIAVAVTSLIAQASNKYGMALARLLLKTQLAVLAAVFIFSIVTRPSTNPHGLMAGIAVMIAVSAMACQYALLRLALPRVVSTAVMTGNLTNAILSLTQLLSHGHALGGASPEQLKMSLRLLGGFFLGCVAAAAAVSFLADWAWALPVALAALATVLPDKLEGYDN